VAEAFESGDEVLEVFGGLEASEVVAAGFAVDLACAEHVPGGDDDRVFDGADRAAVAATRLEAPVLSREVGVAAASGAALAGRGVVAGTEAGPAGEVSGGREDAHVGTDL
jgi:hypothetical protein